MTGRIKDRGHHEEEETVKRSGSSPENVYNCMDRPQEDIYNCTDGLPENVYNCTDKPPKTIYNCLDKPPKNFHNCLDGLPENANNCTNRLPEKVYNYTNGQPENVHICTDGLKVPIYSCTPKLQGPGGAIPRPGTPIGTLVEEKKPIKLQVSPHCLYCKCNSKVDHVPKHTKDPPRRTDKEEKEAAVQRPPKAKEKGNTAAQGAHKSKP